jgi:hypothetical protein
VKTAAITLAGTPEAGAVRAAEPYAVGMLGAGEALARWWLAQPGVPIEGVIRQAHDLVEGVFEVFRRGAGAARARVSTRRNLMRS